ncbi:MAG: 2-phospho-L-lactate guanylyltransferase [Chloroflexota bacterium]
MKTWAVVPVKSFEQAKSRLASVLSAEERRALIERLLRDTLDTIAGVEAIETTLVVSGDPAARGLARRRHARVLDEGPTLDLNLALHRATRLARRHRVARVLILPADLPLLTSDDVRALLAAAPEPPSLVIAPDRHTSGTNALLIAPPGLIEYAFGIGSFSHHRERALAAGAQVAVCERPGLALDLDAPEDLALLQAQSHPAAWPQPSE